MPEDLFRCDAVALKATEKALLVDIDGDEHWIPQSQIHEDSEVWKKGDEGELVITMYCAKMKGLI